MISKALTITYRKSAPLSLGLTLLLILLGLPSLQAASYPFDVCQKKLLQGKTLKQFIQEERASEKPNNELISQLEKLNKKEDCLSLLKMALLKKNGLLENRNPVSSAILKTFVDFHHQWLMPQDFDRAPRCRDPYQDDLFDPLIPAYHLTRALFQEDRNVSLAITAYGDLRAVREGENPTSSPQTNLSSEDYQKILGLDKPFDFSGENPLIGFLYQRPITWKNVADPNWSQTNKNWDQSRQKGEFRLYHHQGAGLLGSPSFLVHYAPKEVSRLKIYKADGRKNLPRKLAAAILKNILCLDPLKFKAPENLELKKNWNHPITQEKQCLNCHHDLDQMAAGMRHLTYLASPKKCANGEHQIVVPSSFETAYAKELWSGQSEEQEFSFSYPIGYFKEEKFVGFSQLGRLLAKRPEFYQCQVSRYFDFFHKGRTSFQKDDLERLAQSYQEHQNGLKLLAELLTLKTQAPQVSE